MHACIMHIYIPTYAAGVCFFFAWPAWTGLADANATNQPPFFRRGESSEREMGLLVASARDLFSSIPSHNSSPPLPSLRGRTCISLLWAGIETYMHTQNKK